MKKKEDHLPSVEEQVYLLLREKGYTVCTAESCTGGLAAAKIVNIPGASEVFETGYITYANEAKERLLGVKSSTLHRYGAVSEQTAREMAEGAVRASGSRCSIVTTGIAGPDGGTAQKPVGLVYIGCCINEKTTVREYRFQGSRSKIREDAAQAALELLAECLRKTDR